MNLTRLDFESIQKVVEMMSSEGWQIFLCTMITREDVLMRELVSYKEGGTNSESDDILRGRLRELVWIATLADQFKKEYELRKEQKESEKPLIQGENVE